MMLEGRVAIVSGVGPGLGRSTALALAREGADIVLAARTKSALESVAEEVASLGRQTLVVPTDISKEADAEALADRTHQRFGRIDILINNAFAQGPYETVIDSNVDEWRETVDIGLVGTMCMCKYVARYMIEGGSGAIVNVTSLSMRRGIQLRSAYSAAKAGITLLSQSLADELGRHGIRVNCLAPGHIWSDKLRGFYETRAEMLGKTYDEVYAMYAGETALKRIPAADEIAAAIVFLASDMASAITGQSLDANAGHYFH
ncbi:MAG: SDR family oxidoreductase [Chloroflexi bacterium]|nr:SDR family oxidoreductase [Chloroflexota bacterium]